MAIFSKKHQFIFLLAPGTGSTVVAETLTESKLGVWLPGEDLYLGQEEEEKELVPTKHTHYGHFQRWGLVEKPLADYSIVSSVRNPFDFWVSEYTRHRTRWSVSLDNPESHIYKNHGDDMVRKSLELEFGEWLEYRWEKFGPKHTQLLHPKFTGNADHLLRFEQLEDSFQSWLRGLGLAAPPGLPRKNTTKRESDYRGYYDRSSRKLIERIFKPYLKRFDYSF